MKRGLVICQSGSAGLAPNKTSIMKNKLMFGSVLGAVTALCLSCGSLLAQDDNGGGPGGPPPGQPGDGGPGGPPPGDSGNGGPGGPGGNFDPAQFQQHMLNQIRQSLSITNDDEWTAIQPLIQKVMDAQRGLHGGGPPSFGGRGRPGQQASSEQQTLQKAIDENVPVPQIKDALARYRATRKAKQAELESAQNDLKSVLTVKQEAQAVLMGLLP